MCVSVWVVRGFFCKFAGDFLKVWFLPRLPLRLCEPPPLLGEDFEGMAFSSWLDSFAPAMGGFRKAWRSTPPALRATSPARGRF